MSHINTFQHHPTAQLETLPLSVIEPQHKTTHPFQNWLLEFKKDHPQIQWAGLRWHRETTHSREARNQNPLLNHISFDKGIMVEVMVDGHIAYFGTAQISKEGVFRALAKAFALAQATTAHALTRFQHEIIRPPQQGSYQSPLFKGLDSETLKNTTEFLQESNRRLKVESRIINTHSKLGFIEVESSLFSTSGTEVHQKFLHLTQSYSATAQEGTSSQTRTLNGGVAQCLQMGLEAWNFSEILNQCEAIGHQAIELLLAPNCPTETRDLILAPDMMLIQIHESIGHPLEIDRILGDERNYAGGSFVQMTDFGHLRYGSPLMNVTFDPSVPGEFASYGFDDGGAKAQRKFLIRDGILQTGLGGLESQTRSHLEGVSNFRSASWNRAPIDRMANINLEPGSSSLQEMISQTEKGIFMEANVSWSIDDTRNKFQFGAEYARLIENGKLTHVVKNPNYRGSTIPFWNSLSAVGNGEEVEIYGSPWCGKGEPNQVIRVGHSAPPCLFKNIEIFGGAS